MDIYNYLSNPIGIEKELRTFLSGKEDIVIFDIGACEGEDSIRYSKMFPKSKIYSFEPREDNFKKINENINIFNSKNICVINEALSDSVGEVDFYVSEGHPEYLQKSNDWNYGNKSSSLFEPTGNLPKWLEFKRKERVKTNTICNFCKENNIDHIDFIHLDVQGAELLVLGGAEEYIKNIKMIWLEVELIELYKNQPLKNKVIDFIKNNNFSIIKDVCGNEAGDILCLNNY